MAGITIDILSNVRDAVRGAKQTGEALDDVADSLDDLVRDGKRAGDKLGDELSDGMKDAARDADRDGRKIGDGLSDGVERGTRSAGDDVDKLEHKFRDLAAATRRADLDPGTSIAKTTKQGMKEAGESVETFRDEAKSNLSEVASSFTGDAQSITDLLQGTLGGVIADLGPLGLAAGAAGAAAIGLIGQAFVEAGEDQEAFKERVSTMTQELVDEFADTEDAVSKIDAKLRQWASDNDRYGVSLTDLRKDAKSAGVGFDELATTIAGGTTKELRKMQKSVDEAEESLRHQAAAVDTTAGADRSASRAAKEKADRLRKDVLPAIKQQIEANENAKAAEEALADANGMTVSQYRDYVAATGEAKEATEAFADSMSTTLADAAESTSDKLDNSVLDASKYIAGLDARVKAAEQYQANVQAIGEQLPADLFNFVREQGPGFSQEIATYLSATPEQQAQIRSGWEKAAGAGEEFEGPTVKAKGDTSDVDEKTAEKGKETKAGPTSKLRADAKDVDKKTAELGREKNPGPTSKLRVDTKAVDDAIAKYRDKTYHSKVVFSADTSAVTAALNRLDGRHISVVVDQKVGKKVA